MSIQLQTENPFRVLRTSLFEIQKTFFLFFYQVKRFDKYKSPLCMLQTHTGTMLQTIYIYIHTHSIVFNIIYIYP